MAKWFLIAIAAGICVFYGYMSADRLRRREQSLGDFIVLFSTLKNEMAYSKRDIEETLKWITPLLNKRLYAFIKVVLEGLESPNMSIKKAFENAINTCINAQEMYLTHEDTLILLNAAAMLGTTDFNGQEQVIEGVIEQLKLLMSNAKDICVKKGQLYKKLGVFVSAAIIVIFL